MKVRLHVALAFVVALVAPSAQALLIRVDFSGTVSSIADSSGALTGVVSIGDPFSGQLLFDSDLTDSEPSASQGRYLGAGTSLSATFGSLAEDNASFPVTLDVYDDQNVIGPSPALDDAFFAGVRPPSGSGTYSTLSMNLGDQTAAVFTSDALPTSLDLADFDFAEASLFCAPNLNSVCANFWSVRGSMDTLSLQVVPEPSTFVLVGSSLAVLSASRRGRRPAR